MSRRTPYVSRHRQELDRIKTDAASNRAHPIPEKVKMSSTENVVSSHLFRAQSSVQQYINSRSASDWAETALPALRWLKTYDVKDCLMSDVIAGLSVGVMVVPQSLSYAKLAGLPVEFGLYSALVPIFAYSMFGSSRQLAVGPVALISLMLSNGLSKVMEGKGPTEEDPSYQEEYIRLAVQTSFLVGLTTMFMGLARLGFVTIFLSHAVISGFTTGAAVIIGASQLKYIVGYDMPRSDKIYEILHYLFGSIGEFQWPVFLMGFSAILFLMGIKHVGKTVKNLKWTKPLGPLLVTVIGIVLVVTLDLHNKGIPIVGYIPRGLPKLSIDYWTPVDNFGQLYVVVLSITIIGFMESIAIAKQLAAKHKYEIDSSQELLGLGISNFLGSMFMSYPITGSFSRSAVSNESGAKTGLSGIITGCLVMMVLLFLTPIFEKLPTCILGAIVISGVIGLLDYPEAIYLWKVHRFDFCVWVVAFLGTMLLGVETGLFIAITVSILIVIYEAAYPHTAVLGRLPGTTVYRNIKQYPEAERTDGVLIVRVDAPLFFANASNVRDKFRKYRLNVEEDLANRSAGELKYLIVDLTPVSHIDTSALHILEDMQINFSTRGQQLVFSNPSLRVMNRFVASGLLDKIGKQHFFSCSHDALKWCLDQMDNEAVSTYNGSVHGGNNDDTVDEMNNNDDMGDSTSLESGESPPVVPLTTL